MGAELPVIGAASQVPQGSNPVLLVVDAEAALACALELDLRREFADRGFEAHCLDSAGAALNLARSLQDTGGHLALVVVDQEIASGGTSLISQIRELHPHARTILLVRHGDIEQAIDATNAGLLDHFLVTPLVSSEQQLLPVAADLLDDWSSWRKEDERKVRIVGAERSEEAQRLREFLRLNFVAYGFVDVEREPDAARDLVGDAALDPARLPAVALGDGTRLERPTGLAIAQGLGLATAPSLQEYDLAIVGGGPAGLGAAVSAASEGLETVLIEKRGAAGGQAGQSSKIENYVGFPGGVSGMELARRALEQSLRFRAEIVRLTDAIGLRAKERDRLVTCSGGAELSCKVALIACGVSYRRLEAPGVDELAGRGVFYGAAMGDAREFEGQDVAIVGGANSAGQAALHFAEHARRVTLLVRGPSLERSMSRYLVERVVAHERIEVRTATRVAAAAGGERLESLDLFSQDSGAATLRADVLFIFIGAVPHTDWLSGAVERDERGFILTGRDLLDAGRAAGWPLDREPLPLETSVPGVFAAGDVRHGSTKRVASAVGEGAMAVQLIHQYLTE